MSWLQGVRLWKAAVTIAVLGATVGLATAGDANAAKGLVADRCVKCHDTPYTKSGERTEAVNAPSFQAMADDPASYSPVKMRASLRQPHFPMQRFTLSKRDIENILAYIDSLKK